MSASAATVLDRIATVPGSQHIIGRSGAWFVGGAVRDALLGTQIRDLDIVVEGGAVAIARAIGEVVSEHQRFGTAEVLIEGGIVNVADARTETYAHPGALPDVAPATVGEDLARRDFTINAIAVRADGGEMIAHPDSLEDIEAGVLRVLHSESFVDDPTRALRMARYVARLGLTIEPETARLARGADLSTVSGTRWGAEILLALDEPDPVGALREMQRLGFLEGWDLALAEAASGVWPAAESVLAGALARLGAHEVSLMLDLWGVAGQLRNVCVVTALRGEQIAADLTRAGRPSEIAAAVRKLQPPTVAVAGALGPRKQALQWLEQLQGVGLVISGDDLLASGTHQGPGLGARLDRTLDAVLDGEIARDDREAQLAHALAYTAMQLP